MKFPFAVAKCIQLGAAQLLSAALHSGKFHVVFAGGKHIKTAAVHRMCKVYYPTNNKTSPISDMLDCRLANSVISLNDTMYSVGGYCGNSLKNAECYDPVNKKWSRIEPMNSGRFYFGICAHANLICIQISAALHPAKCSTVGTIRWP